MVIKPRKLTNQEIDKLAEFYVDDYGLSEDFSVGEALNEINNESALLEAFDLDENSVLIIRLWFYASEVEGYLEKFLVEKNYEEYLLKDGEITVVTEEDLI